MFQIQTAGPLWHHKMSYFICHLCCTVLCHCVENTMSELMLCIVATWTADVLRCLIAVCPSLTIAHPSHCRRQVLSNHTVVEDASVEQESKGERVWGERKGGDRKHCTYHSCTDGAADEMGVEDRQIRRDSKREKRYGKRMCVCVLKEWWFKAPWELI